MTLTDLFRLVLAVTSEAVGIEARYNFPLVAYICVIFDMITLAKLQIRAAAENKVELEVQWDDPHGGELLEIFEVFASFLRTFWFLVVKYQLSLTAFLIFFKHLKRFYLNNALLRVRNYMHSLTT